MREATGGLLLLDLVVIIIFVFIFFISSFMAYTRVYKIKGEVINAIERGEGGVKSEKEMTKVLKSAGYVGAYKFCKHRAADKRGIYYSIELYSDVVILPRFFAISVPIVGHTRTIDTGIFYTEDQDIVKEGNTNVHCDESECCLWH